MKNLKKIVKNWLDSAEYDLTTAEHMLKAGRYIYTVFMCHLAIEKVLKAKAGELTKKTPPKTHDLEYLMELAKLSPDKDMNTFIVELSDLSVVTRYPDDFQRMFKDFTKERAKMTFKQTKEVCKWIKKFITL